MRRTRAYRRPQRVRHRRDLHGYQAGRFAGPSRMWARLGSNQRPLACEASALPLSYAPGRRRFYALACR